MSTDSYASMQKNFYDSGVSCEDVVGNYAWHEQFPYETQLLYRNGDLRFPLLDDYSQKTALDFACGPGRMIPRMEKFFAKVDGVDISQKMLEIARKNCPTSTFYETMGSDLGGAPSATYDFIYSTIAIQHIAVRSIRMGILGKMAEVLKPRGAVCLQLGFNADFPWIYKGRQFDFMGRRIVFYHREKKQALWHEDKVDALETNGRCDVVVDRDSLPQVVSDFSVHFENVRYWFYDVSLIYNDLNGARHSHRLLANSLDFCLRL